MKNHSRWYAQICESRLPARLDSRGDSLVGAARQNEHLIRELDARNLAGKNAHRSGHGKGRLYNGNRELRRSKCYVIAFRCRQTLPGPAQVHQYAFLFWSIDFVVVRRRTVVALDGLAYTK